MNNIEIRKVDGSRCGVTWHSYQAVIKENEKLKEEAKDLKAEIDQVKNLRDELLEQISDLADEIESMSAN